MFEQTRLMFSFRDSPNKLCNGVIINVVSEVALNNDNYYISKMFFALII